MISDTVLISIERFALNSGQLPGVPQNPRQITRDRLESLKKSISEFPDMLHLREVIAVGDPADDSAPLIIIAGNMRYQAARELGITELPAKILPPDTDPNKLAQIVIKDNSQWGDFDYDILANEWTDFPLVDWGVFEVEEWNADALKDEALSPDKIEEISSADPHKYPLAIILTLQDFKRWNQLKLAADLRDDTEAALFLLNLWEKAETSQEPEMENI